MSCYSLLSRFQGAWLGSAIGEALTCNGQKSDWLKIVDYQPSEGMLAGEKIARFLSSSCDQTEPFNWQEIAIELEKLDCREQEIVGLILPLVLFCHENLSLLQEQLQQLLKFNQNYAARLDDVVLWSYAIALVLRGKLNFTQSLDSIILSVGEQQTSLVKRLNQAVILSSQGESLKEVVVELYQANQSNPIQTGFLLAWYCFQSSPNNFSLCIRRAINIGLMHSNVVVLTGALAGAYNGMTGIPLNWRLGSQNNLIYQRIERQSQALLASWSGMYQPNLTAISTSTFAAAGVIQPRSCLKIISQDDSNLLK